MFTLKDLNEMETIRQSQTDDLKYETAKRRVWLSRMTKEDGMPYDNEITVEGVNMNGDWITLSQYPGGDWS